MAAISNTYTLDPLRAGCCAIITYPASLEQHARTTGCPGTVVYAGMVRLGERRVVAFACQRHYELLDDAAMFGADPRYRAGLVRRRDRDRWLHGSRR